MSTFWKGAFENRQSQVPFDYIAMSQLAEVASAESESVYVAMEYFGCPTPIEERLLELG